MSIEPGAKFEAKYPFIRSTYTDCDGDGPYEAQSWRPGVRYENCGPYGDTEEYADAEGSILLEVIATFKPGKKYPMRVFFVRKWRRPDGSVFGKGTLRITTAEAFRRMAAGWRHGEYIVEDSGKPA